MIKKFISITFIFLVSFLTLIPSVKADSVLVSEPAANTGGLWHHEDGNRVYVHMRYTDGSIVRESGSVTNSAYPDYDYSDYTYWESQRIEDNYIFPNTSSLKSDTIANPDPTVYDKFVVEIVSDMLAVSGSSPTVKLVRSYTDEMVNSITVDLVDYNDPTYGDIFPYVALTINGEEVLTSQRVVENPYYNDQMFGVRMYWEKDGDTTEIDSGVIDPGGTGTIDGSVWDLLPITTGSPVNPVGDWGQVSNFTISTTFGQRVSFDINYLGDLYSIVDIPFSGSLDFVEKANDILYYHDPNTGDKILYFNFGDTLNDAILRSRTFSTINEWKGEALWNLSKNEVKTTNKLNVYNYTEVDNDGNVYSYFYMPDVPIDDLISVSSVLAYRYYDDGILGIGGGFGDVQYKTVAAVRGESSTVNPTWVESVYTGSYIASGLAAAATITGLIPGYGWAIAGVTFLAGAILNVSDVQEWFAYDVNQIQHVIPNVALTNNINNYIQSVGGDHIYTDTDKLYKLHLATLDNSNEVQIENELSHVTQVVWETDGEIYVVNEEYINDPGWGGPGTDLPDGASSNLDTNTIIWIAAVAVFIFLYQAWDLKKNAGLTILVIGGIVFVLYKLGMF